MAYADVSPTFTFSLTFDSSVVSKKDPLSSSMFSFFSKAKAAITVAVRIINAGIAFLQSLSAFLSATTRALEEQSPRGVGLEMSFRDQ
jgi:hypothetical protein